MEYIIKDPERIYEELMQNAQKGEFYLVKLKDEPVAFLAIPYIDHNLGEGNQTLVSMKIIEPEATQGLIRNPLKSIEFIQKRVE